MLIEPLKLESRTHSHDDTAHLGKIKPAFEGYQAPCLRILDTFFSQDGQIVSEATSIKSESKVGIQSPLSLKDYGSQANIIVTEK